MIIIKCFGVDPYVTGAYSKKYIPHVKERFHIEDDFLVIAPDEYIYHDGVEQTSWQGILEVIISPRYKAIEEDLAHALLSYFTEEVVNIRLFFNYIEEERFYKFENKDYPPFIIDKGAKEDEEEIEPYTGDIFEGFEERARAAGHNVEHEHDHHHHDDADDFN